MHGIAILRFNIKTVHMKFISWLKFENQILFRILFSGCILFFLFLICYNYVPYYLQTHQTSKKDWVGIVNCHTICWNAYLHLTFDFTNFKQEGSSSNLRLVKIKLFKLWMENAFVFKCAKWQIPKLNYEHFMKIKFFIQCAVSIFNSKII